MSFAWKHAHNKCGDDMGNCIYEWKIQFHIYILSENSYRQIWFFFLTSSTWWETQHHNRSKKFGASVYSWKKKHSNAKFPMHMYYIILRSWRRGKKLCTHEEKSIRNFHVFLSVSSSLSRAALHNFYYSFLHFLRLEIYIFIFCKTFSVWQLFIVIRGDFVTFSN